MTTLAAPALRPQELGDVGEYAMIASDIIYAGAATGLVAGTGHARPLVGGDKFVGFAEATVDNSGGGAAVKRVRTLMRGMVELAVSGAVITDVGQPVYAQDDNAFSFNPVAGSFVGFVARWVSAGIAVVAFDATRNLDPWRDYPVREAITGTKTLDAEDTGKLFAVTEAADADQITLPAVATGVAGVVFLAVGAFGTTAMLFDTDNVDGIILPDIAAGDGKTLTLTKATQRRGDWLKILGAEADGYLGSINGTFVREA